MSKKKKTKKTFLPEIDLLKGIGKAKFLEKDHYFLLDYESEGWFGIEIYNKESHCAIEAEDILSQYEHTLSQEKKELFTFIRDANFWDEDMQYGKLFRLLRDSGMKLYCEYKSRESELKFSKNVSRIKICLSVSKKNRNFIFKIEEGKKSGRFFLDEKNIIRIKKGKIAIFRTNKVLNNIFNRALSGIDESSAKNNFSTILNEEEILEINMIKKDAETFFDLEGNLRESYKISFYDKAKKAVLVDYDSAKEVLNISFAIDYGAKSVDLAKTICYSKLKNQEGFKFREEDTETTPGSKYIMSVNERKVGYAKRQKAKELDFFKEIYKKRKYFGLNKYALLKIRGKNKIKEFIDENWPKIKKEPFVIIYKKDKLEFSDAFFHADFSVDLNAMEDWLTFDVDCHFGDNKVSIDELHEFIEEKKDYIRAEDGSMLRVKNRDELEKFILMLSSFRKREGNLYKGKLYHAMEIESYLNESEYFKMRSGKAFRDFIKEAKTGKVLEEIKFNKNENAVLRSYQKQGVNWLYFLRKYRFGGILADDMGLGKTVQALTILRRENKKDKPSLVVCPKTLIFNWQDEVNKFAKNLKTGIVDGPARVRKKIIKNFKNYDLLITSYATLRNDISEYRKNNICFNYNVIDEAQFIKNHRTQNSRTVKTVNSDYRLALSGTPLENSVSEIWSIFDFLMPGFLGTNKFFNEKYLNPIMNRNNKNALDSLRKKTKCFMLRRSKKEVLRELPDKIENISRCRLENDQNILYQEILSGARKKVFDVVKKHGFKKSYIHILAALTKLRQVCNHPVLVLEDKNYLKYESAKLNMFLQLLREIIAADRKVLVFSQFTSMLDILERELEREKITYNVLTGKSRNRQEIVNSFNNDENIKVFLISLKAGGTGLNLTSADNVIIFDPWWNPSVENQAIDRTHRIGQKKAVNVYRLITADTIEEKIIKLQRKKKFLFDNLVSESEDVFEKLTWDDVRDLFSD